MKYLQNKIDTIPNQKSNDSVLFVYPDTVNVKSADLKQLNNSIEDLRQEIITEISKKEPKLLGAKYDTVFTVLVTLLIFILGIIIDRIIKRKQEKKELEELRSYFLNQISELNTQIGPALVRGYNDYYRKTISIDKGIPTTPPKMLMNNFDRLLHMESDRLFKSFPKDSKDKFNKYFSKIDFISNLLREVDSFHDVVLHRSEQIRNNIVALDFAYIKSLAEFTEFEKYNTINYEQTRNYRFIAEKLQLYHRNYAGKRKLSEYYIEIIRSIQSYIVRETDLHTSHPVGEKIADLGKQFSHNYNDLRLLTIEVRLQYREFAVKINKAFEDIRRLEQ